VSVTTGQKLVYCVEKEHCESCKHDGQ